MTTIPTYEYRCLECEHLFEDFHPMSAPHPEKCPECGGKIRIVFAPVAFKMADRVPYHDKKQRGW